jgi:hypothetical protein
MGSKMSALAKPLHNFSFLVSVSGIDVSEDRPYEDALLEAGCDDALIVVINGELKLDFDREAASFDEAINSAIADIQKAGGQVTHVERSSD